MRVGLRLRTDFSRYTQDDIRVSCGERFRTESRNKNVNVSFRRITIYEQPYSPIISNLELLTGREATIYFVGDEIVGN